MSINELAAAAGVGYTSVFRFCKSIKMKGYKEFKTALSLCVAEENESNVDKKGVGGLPEDSFLETSNSVLKNCHQAMFESLSQIDRKQFERLVEILVIAPHVNFYGVGGSMPIALTAMTRFLRIFPRVSCFEDSYTQAISASMLRADDVAIVISYSGRSNETVKVARLAKEAGAFVACITRYDKSPLTAYADVVLICGGDDHPIISRSISSYISQLYLIELLFLACYHKRRDLSNYFNRLSIQTLEDRMININETNIPRDN
jgi:DNA-binding MurR/RpiR family transcriptional regulator